MIDQPIITTYAIQREKELIRETLDANPFPRVIIFSIIILYILTYSIYSIIHNRKLTLKEQKQQRENHRKDFDDFANK